ncbi:MAG TPA: hypothetical protein P5548_02375 [Candidatus Moranbacteria bacterium]|nr:hypothetical protein [Candidatus Moranbacteria bacterium]HRZ33714.1 hypothetical protein [Candidatus Moranbacteria bacterium]
MFDLTEEIKLENYLRKKYLIAKFFLYLFFLIGTLFILNRIIFPLISFSLSFDNINSPKNTLDLSSTMSQAEAIKKGFVKNNEDMIFTASPLGNFSYSTIKLKTSKDSENIEGTSIKIRRSYEAFFYPTGDPVGFRNGTLLFANGSYYIISGDALRKFSNNNIVEQLGYSKDSFLNVSLDDLKYNKNGADITDANIYPDDTFFNIGDTYYQLKNRQLFPFVSAGAFLSKFESGQAIIKNDDFLNRYKISETYLGFTDGTLASLAPSVFFLSEEKSYPISNAETFVKKGFNWDDVIQINSEELSIYKKQKQFTYNQPHPDGTLFLDRKTNTYFIIKDKQKRPIESLAVAKTYSKQKPVIVDSEESETIVSCQLKKVFFPKNTYECDAMLNSMNNFIGIDFQIDLKFANNAKINNASITFFTAKNFDNFMAFLSGTKTSLIINYTK